MSNLWETFYINTETRYIEPRQFWHYNAIFSDITEDGIVMSKLSGSYMPCFIVYVKSLRDYSIFRSTIMRLLMNTLIHSLTPLMIDGDKKVVSKQPFVSFPKVNSLQSWEYYAKIALILSLGMNYSIVINKCF